MVWQGGVLFFVIHLGQVPHYKQQNFDMEDGMLSVAKKDTTFFYIKMEYGLAGFDG